jgi:HK97 gp10 family phage protein
MTSADGIRIDVRGIDALEKRLYLYSRKLGDKVVIDSLKHGARLIQSVAKRGAPKATGRLRRAISLRQSKIYSKRRHKDGKIGVYITVSKGKKRGDQKGAYYGAFVEHGTKNMRGAYFLKRAYDSEKDRAVSLTIQTAERGADVIAKRLGL